MAHRKLLVADDSVTIQKVIRLALGGNQPGGSDTYEIMTVGDGTVALQQLSLFRPDIVLVDVNLPHKNAIEVKQAAEAMGDEFKNTRFVLLSSAFEKLDEAALSAASFEHRLSKPFDPALLRQVLGAVAGTLPSQTPNPDDTARSRPPVQGSSPLVPEDSDEAPPPPRSPESAPASLGLRPPPPPSELSAPISIDNIKIELNLPPPVRTQWTPPAPVSAPGFSPDEDIKRLTEETLRQVGSFDQPSVTPPGRPLEPSSSLSPGLMSEDAESDEFGWSVNENAVRLDDLKPDLDSAPSKSEQADSTPSLPPFSAAILRDIGGNDFPLTERPASMRRAAPDLSADLPIPPPPRMQPDFSVPIPPPAPASDPAVSPLSVEQMEEILSRQLESSIRNLAQKILPDLAERIIKDEINRMLREQNL